MLNPVHSPSNEDHLLFFISPPLLQRLASQEMALIIWRQEVQNRGENVILSSGWFYDHGHESVVVEGNGITPVWAQMITDCIFDPVCESIIEWIDYHAKYVFFDCNLHDAILSCIDELVLKPDGRISFLSTAKNILESEKLSTVEKYRFACLNCLADDVRSMWPWVYDDPRVTTCDSESNPMVYYWTFSIDSAESRMVVWQDMEWTTVEYFWNMVSEDERITALVKLLKRCDTSLIERLFLKMNETRLRRVLDKISICDVFLLYLGDKVETMLCIWKLTKDVILGGDFVEIIFLFIRTCFMIYPFNGGEPSPHLCSILSQIWTSAPDRLRYFVSNNVQIVESIFEELSKSSYREVELCGICDSFDMSFFIALLNDINLKSRRYSLWCKYWRHIIMQFAPKYLNQLMNLCFNNKHEIVQFTERHMMDFKKIENFCCLLITHGKMCELNEYLYFCSLNVHYIASVKRLIIESSEIRAAFLKDLNEDKFIDFDEFVDGAFFDVDDIKNYKKEFIASSKVLQDFYAKMDKTKLAIRWM